MKCYSCGGEVSLTDKTCPYCGRSLTETANYRKDKEAYEKRSEKAKGRLAKAVSSNVPIVISAVVMVLLIIGVSVAVYVKENAYHFRGDAMRKEAKNNYIEYSKTIRDYLDAGDYTGFYAFKEYHNIAEFEEPYEDLKLLWDMTRKYALLVSDVEEAVLHGPEARWYRPEDDVANVRRSIDGFYNEYAYKLSEINADSYGAYMHDMKKKADAILKVYLRLDGEKLEEFLNSSMNKKEAYLEEVILHD